MTDIKTDVIDGMVMEFARRWHDPGNSSRPGDVSLPFVYCDGIQRTLWLSDVLGTILRIQEKSNTMSLLLLRIRNAVAAREFNTAEANREITSGDGWLWDHSARDRELAAEIDYLIGMVGKAENLPTGKVE